MIHLVKVRKDLPRGYRAKGRRSKCEVLVYVDMAEAMKNGIRFFNTKNGSIVSHGAEGLIPFKYLTMIFPIDHTEANLAGAKLEASWYADVEIGMNRKAKVREDAAMGEAHVAILAKMRNLRLHSRHTHTTNSCGWNR